MTINGRKFSRRKMIKNLLIKQQSTHGLFVITGLVIRDDGGEDPEGTFFGKKQQEHAGDKVDGLTIPNRRTKVGECDEDAAELLLVFLGAEEGVAGEGALDVLVHVAEVRGADGSQLGIGEPRLDRAGLGGGG